MQEKGFYCIIEHPRRGTLRDLELDHGTEEKARFSLTGARNDPEKTMILHTIAGAFTTLNRIPTPTRYECSILLHNPHDGSYYKLEKTR